MKTIKLAKQAIEMDDSPAPHRTLAGVFVYMRKYDKAIVEGREAIK